MNGRSVAKVLAGVGKVVPGVGPAFGLLGRTVQQIETICTPPEDKKREVYRAGGYRVVVWLERGFATAPHLYVAVERQGYYGIRVAPKSQPPEEVWQHVRTWSDVQVIPAPWWKPWRRKHELVLVIDQAIAFVDQQETLETTAQATLEAVTEVMRPT